MWAEAHLSNPKSRPAAPKPVRSFVSQYKALPAFLVKPSLSSQVWMKKLVWLWPNLLSRPVSTKPIFHHATLWAKQHDKHAENEYVVDYLKWGMKTFEDFCESGAEFADEVQLEAWNSANQANYMIPVIFRKGHRKKGIDRVLFMKDEIIRVTELWVPEDAGGKEIGGRIAMLGYRHSKDDRFRLF